MILNYHNLNNVFRTIKLLYFDLGHLHFQIQNNTTQLAEASENIAQSEQALVDVQAELLELLRTIETEEKLSCKPCGLHGYKACPKGHFKCGETISV